MRVHPREIVYGAGLAARAHVRWAPLVLLLSSCKEEYAQHDLHILNPRHDTDGTDPVSAPESTDAGATSTAPSNSDASAADATMATPAAPIFVSDIAFTVVANGYGPAEKNTSNGENASGDGKTITL